MNLLNLSSPEDIYELMNDVAEEARGGSLDDSTRRQLEIMDSYRLEIATCVREQGTEEWLQAALSYILEMADLCCHLDESYLEKDLIDQAKVLAKRLLERSGDLESFQRFCRVMHRKLSLLWYEEDELAGKTTCGYFLATARMFYRAHPEWNREEFLEELAKIYGVNAKWFGIIRNVQDCNRAWSTLCTVRSGRIRLYLDTLRCRKDLENLLQNLLDASAHYMNPYWDWDLKQARSCLFQALNLMKRNPWLPNSSYLTATAYGCLARTYEEEEEYARIKHLEFPEQKRIACRAKARAYRIRELNGRISFLAYRQRSGLDTDVAVMCLRDCYEGLAEDCSCLPGEKNAKKAEKYRQKAEELT